MRAVKANVNVMAQKCFYFLIIQKVGAAPCGKGSSSEFYVGATLVCLSLS